MPTKRSAVPKSADMGSGVPKETAKETVVKKTAQDKKKDGKEKKQPLDNDGSVEPHAQSTGKGRMKRLFQNFNSELLSSPCMRHNACCGNKWVHFYMKPGQKSVGFLTAMKKSMQKTRRSRGSPRRTRRVVVHQPN